MFNVVELRKVVSALENASERGVNMGAWVSPNNECGTVACAIGHYCLANPESNLKLKSTGSPFSLYPLLNGEPMTPASTTLSKFFAISISEAAYLFALLPEVDSQEVNLMYLPHQLFDKEYVINRIRRFVTKKIMEYHAGLPTKQQQLQLV